MSFRLKKMHDRVLDTVTLRRHCTPKYHWQLNMGSCVEYEALDKSSEFLYIDGA